MTVRRVFALIAFTFAVSTTGIAALAIIRPLALWTPMDATSPIRYSAPVITDSPLIRANGGAVAAGGVRSRMIPAADPPTVTRSYWKRADAGGVSASA